MSLYKQTRNCRGRRAASQKGSFMIEFAIVGWTLFFMMAGTLQVGLNLNRAMTAAQTCRDANVLTVRGVDLTQSANQQLISRVATGLGLSQAGSWNPDPNGAAVVYVTRVILVGDLECAAGLGAAYDHTNATCINLGRYVITMRIAMGNTSRWTSLTGTPVSATGAGGKISDYEVCTNPGNVTTAFPAQLALTADQFTYVSEVFADTSNIKFFTFLTPSAIYMRNLS